ncbi:MAG: protein kinase [Ignavibacteriales bacterium]|jgi:serine/threonine protein kinase|nr:protein kinase [Ignavibacteriales bacterium]MCC6638723.1 protein kinase [Ignavibacteriaceae bacterium]
MNQMIQSYELLDNLGYGGMAKVLRVRHEITGETRAMKILYEQYAVDPQMEKRFKEEAMHAGKLNHPNIVKVYEYIKEGGNLCIIMEFIEGKPLSQIIGAEVGPIVAAKAIPLFVQIAGAIDHAHNLPAPLIHRDIKPSNVLVTPDYFAKVTDFGIAKVLGSTGNTATGTMIGTMEYMSPEQMTGGVVDQQSDIYSLGITLYEMLAGRLPFTFKPHDSMFDKIRVITSTPIPDPREFYPHIPENLVNVIKKATQKEKSDRFRSVSEMLAAIKDDNYIAPTVIEGYKTPSAEHTVTPSQKSSDQTSSPREEDEETPNPWFWLIALFLVGVIGILIYFIITLLKE